MPCAVGRYCANCAASGLSKSLVNIITSLSFSLYENKGIKFTANFWARCYIFGQKAIFRQSQGVSYFPVA
jgi:hypothetical protein